MTGAGDPEKAFGALIQRRDGSAAALPHHLLGCLDLGIDGAHQFAESKQTDGSIVYELFAEGKPQTPSLEVMWKDGQAKVLTETWPH
ncbi:hypothetical protein [Phenylobacterium sp.]|uniref:hypothetical protein n=1 Tax=Phenylobacterium sp. TaxID=1871053 RepID=UPI0026344849|nr:hypothetical protein [Phenylobacterium sp.]